MTKAANSGRLVTGEAADVLLTLGPQPICHKFVVAEQAPVAEECYPLTLGIGQSSGLVGLIDPPPATALTPIYPWIICNEPEDHLDSLTVELQKLLADRKDKTGAKKPQSILSLSSKDLTLMQRLEAAEVGVGEQYQHSDLTQALCPGVELVQAAVAKGDKQASSCYSLVLARHILEHCHDLSGFANALQQMMSEDGLAVIEVPDNEKAFQSQQHTIIWEEHTLYFTESSLKQNLQQLGFEVVAFYRYPMALEDILLAVVGKAATNSSCESEELALNKPEASASTDAEGEMVKAFAAAFVKQQDYFQAKLKAYSQQHGVITMLGAGHLGAAFVNYYQLQPYINAVLDDDPNKQGLLMPGSQLPIRSSQMLKDGSCTLCLLTCNPWNNDKIAQKFSDFTAAGGQFLSVFQPELWP